MPSLLNLLTVKQTDIITGVVLSQALDGRYNVRCEGVDLVVNSMLPLKLKKGLQITMTKSSDSHVIIANGIAKTNRFKQIRIIG